MNLILNIKKEYFEDIKLGTKNEEYRLFNDYWRKRIIEKPPGYYKNIIIRLGYPKAGDTSKEILFPWNGYELKSIKHKHFGIEDVYVIAIKLYNGGLK